MNQFSSPSAEQLIQQRKKLESLTRNKFKDQSDNLSVSTNDSNPCPPPPMQPGMPLPVYEPFEALVNEAIFQGGKKVAQMKELLLNFEEYFVVHSLLSRPMVYRLRNENFRLLSTLLPTLDDMKYQHHEAIVLSILYITSDNAGLSRKDFLKSIE